MSATAIAVSENEIVLLSDGITIKDGSVHSTDFKKIGKVNGRFGWLWMGVGQSAIGHIVEKEISSMNNTMDMAKCAGKWLKKMYNNPKHGHVLETQPFWVLFVGYRRLNLQAHLLFSENPKPFEPIEHPIQPGLIGAKTANKSETDFNRLLADKYLPLYRPNFAHAAKQAFTEMINTYSKQGEPCGGTIFTEVITP